jgi:ankyrin repeat protein
LNLDYNKLIKNRLLPRLNSNNSAIKIWLSGHAACVASLDTQMDLYLAAWAGNIEIVEKHILKGYDISLADSNGWTTLHFAVWNMHTDVMNLLLKISSQKNWMSRQNEDGLSALHLTAWNGDIDIIKE